jgi:hypothetical protein
MALVSRIHAPAPGAVRGKLRKLDANGPIAPQLSALRRAFRHEKPFSKQKPRRDTIIGPARSASQTLSSRWNLLGCHGISSIGISSVNAASAAPKTGSALHHLVTSVSVKKALMDFGVFRRRSRRSDASRTHPAKMRSGDRQAHCADDIVKE